MKKIFILALLIANYINSSGFDDLGKEEVFLDSIEKHNQAYDALNAVKDKISINTITHFSPSNKTKIYYDYVCPTDEIKAILNKYTKLYDDFSANATSRSAGDAFLLGAIIAVLNKAITKEPMNKKTVGALLASVAGLLACQSNAQKVPYLDWYLKQHDNYFGLSDVSVIARATVATLAAFVSYAGFTYALNRVSGLLGAKKA